MTDIVTNDRCPVVSCRSKRLVHHSADSKLAELISKAWGNRAPCPIDQCADCCAFWEPWPDGTPSDCVERERCDNCAYSAMSAESQRPDEWKELVNRARKAADWDGDGPMSANWFCCHKGIPIKLGKGEGESSIAFDFESAGLSPLNQTCAGFLKMMWAMRGAVDDK